VSHEQGNQEAAATEPTKNFELDNKRGADYRDRASAGGILFIIALRAKVISVRIAQAERAREIG
jgi:hypothetical protein